MDRLYTPWRYDYVTGATRDDGCVFCDVLAATSDWREYGWDAGYDGEGNWKKGLLHAALYIHVNKGTSSKPKLHKGVRLVTEKGPLDSFGLPVPCPADWDGDGRDNLAVRIGNRVLMDYDFNGIPDREQIFGDGDRSDSMASSMLVSKDAAAKARDTIEQIVNRQARTIEQVRAMIASAGPVSQ